MVNFDNVVQAGGYTFDKAALTTAAAAAIAASSTPNPVSRLQPQVAKGDYAAKLNLLHKIESGEAPEVPGTNREIAREFIGDFYANGWGVGQDYAAARLWYQRAIDTPDATFIVSRAKMKLADLYERGLGGPRDHAKAKQLIDSTWMPRREAPAPQNERSPELVQNPVRALPPNARRNCVSTCRERAYSCSSGNSFSNSMGIASNGLSLGTLMRNSINNTDCDGDEQACIAQCR